MAAPDRFTFGSQSIRLLDWERGSFTRLRKGSCMTPQTGISRRNWLIRTTIVTLAMLAFVSLMPVRALAAELAEQAHSLKKVPADAAFYSASLRLKEQWHAF